MTANKWSIIGISLWITALLIVMIVTAGCVIVDKETNVFVIEPVIQVEIE